MNAKIVFVGILVIAAMLFSAGCTKSKQLPQNPKQAYEALALKSKQAAPMKASYDFDLSFGQKQVMGFSSVRMQLDVFTESKEKTKTVASLSLLGQKMKTVVYKINGRTIQCVEGSVLGSGSGVQCQVGGKEQEAVAMSQAEAKSLDELFLDYNISFAGEKTFAGRKSACFLLGYSGKDIKGKNQLSSFTATSLDDYSFKQEICLDEEKGFISYTKISTSIYSQLTKKQEEGVGFTMTLTAYSPTVSESDFELPVVFSLGSPSECTPSIVKLKITPFKKLTGKKAVLKIEKPALGSGKAELEQQVELTLPKLELFEENDLNIQTREPINGSKQLELCVGNDCVQSGCWAFE